MASALHNLSQHDPNKVPSSKGMTFSLVVSEYNEHITAPLTEACIDTLMQYGAAREDIQLSFVPGAYELPGGCQVAAQKSSSDAIIAIGCVIKGDTDHDKYINHSVAQGLMHLNLKYEKPFVFGLLTPNTEQQAIDRSGGAHGNKGVEIAVAAIKMVDLGK